MKLDKPLVDGIRDGRVVLFLGAGASKGAVDSKGKEPPIGQELADLIAEQFLGKSFVGKPLQQVSELAISESSLFAVQDFVASVFRDLRPATFHLRLPDFRWQALVTINFDQVVEASYRLHGRPCQELVVFVSDRNPVDDLLRNPNTLPLLKLHGCISCTRDKDLPLILTPEQYVTHRKGRNRLFGRVEEWGLDYPIVFIGSGLLDIDLRQVLMKLADLGDARPRYYLVTPTMTPQERKFWESRRISILEGTYREFLESLDREIPPHVRRLSAIVLPDQHPIERKFVTQDRSVTEDTRSFLEYDVDYVSKELAVKAADPKAFYRGYNQGWAAVSANLDVRRSLVDTVLLDIILADESDRPTTVEFCVIKAEAGAGKSMLLRRIALEAGRDCERTCLYLRSTGRLMYDPLYELVTKVQDRLFLFVDNAADRVQQIEEVLFKAKRDGLRITIITVERVNEWNIYCERLEDYVTSTYDLRYLSEKEIAVLVDLLEQHQCLGYLANASRQERMSAFVERAGRQLLVALHEATQGKPFVDILVDEYQQIQPQRAQTIYLSICVLNRLGVPVRAGVISRVHRVPFEAFRRDFLAPLEHVVQVRRDPTTGDYQYTARHPLIAQIVFERILTDPEARFDHYVRLLAALDPAYDTDNQAFRGLTRGRTLLELFPDHKAVMEIFKTAQELVGDDSYLFHQMGIYEMRRANGNLNKAQEYLGKARDLTRYSEHAITHSMAELERTRAIRSRSTAEREHHHMQATKLASSILDGTNAEYGYSTLINVWLDRIEELLKTDEATDREIDYALQEAERYLNHGLQLFPENPYLLDAEVRLANTLNQDDRAFSALQKAFDVNQRSPYIAGRLAKAYCQRGKPEDGIRVLERALDGNPSDFRLHFALSRLLIDCDHHNMDKILYHLRRSSSPGDRNYEAQFWYAAYLYMTEEQERMREAKDIFRHLRGLRIKFDVRIKVRFRIMEKGKAKRFSGRLERREASYGHVRRDGVSDLLFVHSTNVDTQVWEALRPGDPLTFEIGFSFGGPLCLGIEPFTS